MGFLEIILKFVGYLVDCCSLNTSSHSDGRDRDGDQIASSSSSSAPPSMQNYEVFLSFRGEETRRTFTSHLYHKLVDRGIRAFRDSEELRAGEKIAQLFEAIKVSKISIPIISPDYASSIWCLKELLQILECKETSGQLVLPIFYNVKPSDVREQKGDFGKRFQQCKSNYGQLVPELEEAFIEVASLKGWESEKIVEEGELVESVVTRIFKELRKAGLEVPDFLVGVEDHVKAIKEMINRSPSNNAKIIGIHGMGGIGKTTLAKVFFNVLSSDFERHSFLPNIREISKTAKGMEALQKQIITNILGDKLLQEISHVDEGKNIIQKSFEGKKLLLLLDDVESKDQLNKLAVEEDSYGVETIVIITTRNKEVASVVNLSYELNELNNDRSYELFCKHAFGRDTSCPSTLEPIARNIVSTTGGLPLAIEVVGSYLYKEGEDMDIWKETLKKLRSIPHEKVRDKLKISYDSLEYEQKQIFLDIACLKIGRFLTIPDEIQSAFCMWDSCCFYPKEGIRKLQSLSLIKWEVGSNRIIMHDQLRDLGMGIVQEGGHNNIGTRSRIWLSGQAMEVLERKQGTPNVEALILKSHQVLNKSGVIDCTSQQFEGITNLRFLHIEDVSLAGDFENHLLNLRWLNWSRARYLHGRKFDITRINFHPKNLVVLRLTRINIKHWKGWSEMKYLKILYLRDCKGLTTTPNISACKLEVLILFDCPSLRKIHPSIGKSSKTLKVLDIFRCQKLEELPIEVGTMEELRTLNVDDSGIREIPISEGCMTKLEKLSVSNCRQLTHIPYSLGLLVKLQSLLLSSCDSLTKIPESIGELCNLELLVIEFIPIKCLPTSIGNLSKLPGLDLTFCMELESLPNLPSSLTSLGFNGESMDTLPDFSNLTNLNKLIYEDLFERRNRALNLRNLNQLETLMIYGNKFHSRRISNLEEEIEIHMAPGKIRLQLELPISLVTLHVSGCKTLHTLNLSILKNLSRLELKKCSQLREINGLEGAESLIDLDIERCTKLSRLGDLSHLKMLRTLQLTKCYELMEINGFEGAESLTNLEIKGGKRLSRLGDLSHLKMLTTLCLDKCSELMEINGFKGAESLTDLKIERIKLSRLGDLSHLKMLRTLLLRECFELTEINGLEGAESLTNLKIERCKKLSRLGDFSRLKMLRTLRLCDCEKLTDVQGIEKLTSLTNLSFSRCHPEINFPNLSMLRDLKYLEINYEGLMEIPGLQGLKSLEYLDVCGCKLLQNLPDLSIFTNLKRLLVDGCENLIEIRGLENLTSLRVLYIAGCTALKKLPDLPNVYIYADPVEEDDEIETGSNTWEVTQSDSSSLE